MYAGILIKRLGYSVYLAQDGMDVVTTAKEKLPAVIVLEQNMPKMNGMSCVRMIRNDVDMKDIPVLVFEPGLDSSTRTEFERLGVSRFLKIPLNIADFYLAVQNCFRHSVKRRNIRAPLNLKVLVECGEDRAELFASDLSSEGMYLRTLKPFQVGSSMSLAFSIDDEDPIELRGEVVSRQGLTAEFDREPGMGIRFLDIPEDSRYRLYYFLMKELTKDFQMDGQQLSVFDETLL